MRVVFFSMPDLIPLFKPHIWQPPSLAGALIAASLREAGHEAFVADLILQRERVAEAVREVLAEYRPQLAALSAMTFQFPTAKRVAEIIKETDPEVKTVLGGYHATLMGEEMSPEDGAPFDFICRGEGDHALAELATALEKGIPLEQVKGISFRRNGGFVHNPRRPLEEVESIPLPDRSTRIWSGYHFGPFSLDIVETSRGCTNNCNFCSMRHMYGRTFRPFPIERVLKDLRDARRRGVRWVTFADDNITLNIRRFEQLCDAIAEAGLNDLGYIVQAECKGIARDPELARKMDRANFRIVQLGIENVSPRNLEMMGKSQINVLDNIKRAIQYLHDNNIMIVGGMIVGNPEDTEEDIAANYRFFDEQDIDFFGDQIMTPYPKTGIREELLRRGLVTNPHDFRLYNGYWANVRTRYLSPDEIQFLRWKYRNRYSTFYKTTKAFRTNHPFVDLYRRVWLRPYRRLKNAILNRGKSERQLYEEAMDRDMALNNFFNDPDYPRSWRRSVQEVELHPLEETRGEGLRTEGACGRL